MALVPILLAAGPLATDQDLAGAFNFLHVTRTYPLAGADVSDGDLQHWWGLVPDPLAAEKALPPLVEIREGFIYEVYLQRHENTWELTAITFTGNILGEVKDLP